jgi:hypothetical protein
MAASIPRIPGWTGSEAVARDEEFVCAARNAIDPAARTSAPAIAMRRVDTTVFGRLNQRVGFIFFFWRSYQLRMLNQRESAKFAKLGQEFFYTFFKKELQPEIRPEFP